MKTIKELEKTIKGVGVIAYIKALKDVLGLIDEMETYAGYPHPNTPMINKEELKSRITG